MKRKTLMICAWIFADATAFASIDMNEVYDWLCFPIGKASLEFYMNQHGCTKEEIIDALFTFAEQPEWSKNRGNEFRRSLAIHSLEEIGSTADLPRIIPLVMDDYLPVHNAAISAYVKITAKSDPDRMFEFADYLLQLPLTPEDLKRHAYVLTCFRWLLADPSISPEIQNGILDYFRRTRFRDQFCAFETDWFFAKSIPEYGNSDERRNLAAIWATSTNAIPGIRNYFVGVQRQFFPPDAPPPEETVPTSVQEPLPGACETVAPSTNEPAPDPVPDPAPKPLQAPRTNPGPWWIAVLAFVVILGIALTLKKR